jgi:hypothetical protein
MAVMTIIFKTSAPAKEETQPVSENQRGKLFGEIVAIFFLYLFDRASLM